MELVPEDDQMQVLEWIADSEQFVEFTETLDRALAWKTPFARLLRWLLLRRHARRARPRRLIQGQNLSQTCTRDDCGGHEMATAQLLHLVEHFGERCLKQIPSISSAVT